MIQQLILDQNNSFSIVISEVRPHLMSGNESSGLELWWISAYVEWQHDSDYDIEGWDEPNLTE